MHPLRGPRRDQPNTPARPLDDSAVADIQKVAHVAEVNPEMRFMAEVRANDEALVPLPLRPLPSSLDDHPPVDLRLRMLASFTDSDREPQLATDPRNTEQIARELHRFAKRFQRDLIYG